MPFNSSDINIFKRENLERGTMFHMYAKQGSDTIK